MKGEETFDFVCSPRVAFSGVLFFRGGFFRLLRSLNFCDRSFRGLFGRVERARRQRRGRELAGLRVIDSIYFAVKIVSKRVIELQVLLKW